MPGPIPIHDRLPILQPDAKVETFGVNVDASVVVRCKCQPPSDAVPFIVGGHVAGVCPACRTIYVIKLLHVKAEAGRPVEISLTVGPQQPSPIVAPGGPIHGARH
jgi:hypothetical protein